VQVRPHAVGHRSPANPVQIAGYSERRRLAPGIASSYRVSPSPRWYVEGTTPFTELARLDSQ
jgi:hypothetical protein